MTTSFIIYNLVSDNSFFFSYSINLIEEIRNNLDKGNIGYYFYWFLETFHTVEHDILLANLELFGIRGVAKNCFKSYLFNRD